MATTYLQNTRGTPTNAQKYTYSFWIKRCELSDGSKEAFLLDGYADASNRSKIAFQSGDQLEIWNTHGGSNTFALNPTRKFRDVASWYHIVLSVDTTQSTDSDRVKLYVNGVQETSLGSTTYPSQNDANNTINESGTTLSIMAYGGNASSDSYRLSSLMTHIHFTDGYAYPASTFGETDSTSGIWKPKTAPSVTYGNNGFFLKFENAGNLDLDSSGNNLTFATSGTLTQNVDTPSNVFATLNSLQPNMVGVPTNGNLTYANPSSGQRHIPSTLAVSSGKWYVEVKCNVVGGDYPQVGIFDTDIAFDTATYIGSTANGYGLSSTGHIWNSNSQQVNTGTTWTTGDILGIALDLTNDKIYWHKNGTYVSNGTGTGNPSTGTNGYSITADKTWYFTNSSNGAGGSPSFSFNFGSGYFGTTQVSSSNADANGHGLMEYAVPTGFYTLNTKNIKEFG